MMGEFLIVSIPFWQTQFRYQFQSRLAQILKRLNCTRKESIEKFVTILYIFLKSFDEIKICFTVQFFLILFYYWYVGQKNEVP